MSTSPEPLTKFEQKNVELISKVSRKTMEGKIKWTRVGAMLFATLPGSIRAEFTVPTTSPIAFLRGLVAADWKSFYIKDEDGNQLVAVENQGPLVNILKGEATIQAAAQLLFHAIVDRATVELERAIDAIDKM
jgi:hypothetical protein